jgi:hypothetical protein
MQQQNQRIEEQQRDYEFATKKRLFELEREFKELSKQRFDLENECRQMENELSREGEDNYTSKMTLDKDKAFDLLAEERHKIEKELNEALIGLKHQKIEEHKAELQKVQD